jgi:hypothetical protein
MTHREQYNEWLAGNAHGNGLTGCAIGFPNKTWICASLSETLEVPAMETAMRCLADTFDVAGLHHIPSLEQKWTFEKVAVFSARRPDKTFIALFFDNTEATDGERIRQIIEDFKGFQPLMDNRSADPAASA